MSTVMLAVPTAIPIVRAAENGRPIADFAWGCDANHCTFESTTSDPDGNDTLVDYAWSFGDGTYASSKDPFHDYSQSDLTYRVTLTATDEQGASDTVTRIIEVLPRMPIETIGFRGSATSNANSNVHTVRVPSTVRAGDALLLFFAENTTATITAPAGIGTWKNVDAVVSNGTRTRVWKRVALASDAGKLLTVRVGATSKASLTVAAWFGTSTADPVAAVARSIITSSGSARTSPVVVVPGPAVGPQSALVSYWTHKDSATTALTVPSGLTARASGSQSGGGRVSTLIADTNSYVGPGPQGGFTSNAAASSPTATAWSIVLAAAGTNGPKQAPFVSFTSRCTDLHCKFIGFGDDPDGGYMQGLAWDFGDGSFTAGDVVEHVYAAPGTYTVTANGSDDEGAVGTTSEVVTVAVAGSPAPISFVGQSSSNANSVNHTVAVPAGTQAGDGLLLFFSENTTAAITDPAGWSPLGTVSGGGATTRVWRKVATAGDLGANVTVSVGSISKAGLSLLAYRGTSATDPVASFSSQLFADDGFHHTSPVVHTTDHSWTVTYWTHKDSATSALTEPQFSTVRASGSQTGGGRVTTLIIDSGQPAVDAFDGAFTAQGNAAATAATGWSIVLQPHA